MTFPKPPRPIDSELAATFALLAAVLTIGFMTVGDYGITSDEFLFDAYGPKALAWYLSGFTDRSWFDYLDERPYGPWFQMLVTAVQSFGLGERFTVRHAVTFVIGIGGLAALLPLARLTVGRWAGFAAIVLCLIAGNLYGHLFFSPNDVPFMATMTWATLVVVVMARDPVPSWGVVVAVGLLTGLAIATRPGGVLVQIYLLAALGGGPRVRSGGRPRADLSARGDGTLRIRGFLDPARPGRAAPDGRAHRGRGARRLASSDCSVAVPSVAESSHRLRDRLRAFCQYRP